MAADMIELECPSCSELLELDPGFAGGVCRCSGCGTLMTVPSKTGRGRAEALTRPDRPEGPGGTAASRRPEAPGRPEAPVAPSPAAAMSREDTQTFVTSTGKVVQVRAGAHIPTAGKRQRKGIRIATIVVFCLVVALVLAACIWAISLLATTKPGTTGPDLSDPTQQALRLFTHDPAANPITLEHPSVLGLPMNRKTVVVVDLPGASADDKAAIAKVLGKGLNRSGVRISVLIIATDAAKPLAFNGGMTSVGSIDPDKLAKWMADLSPKDNQLAAAITAAAADNPDQIIVITTQRLRDVGPVSDALASRPTLPVDAVAINNDSVALQDFARQRNGSYLLLNTRRLRDWIDEAP